MKKFASLSLMCLLLSVACTSDNQSDTTSLSSESTNTMFNKGENPCPEGTYAVLEFEFNTFRFKRPKFECEKRFWLCSDGEWVTNCYDRNGVEVPKKAELSLQQHTARVVAYPDTNNKKIKFLFPYDLVNQPGNNVDDFKIFSVDKEIEMVKGVKLVGGDYPTTFDGDQIVVIVDLY